MGYTKSKTISVEKIPVINVSPLRKGTSEEARSVGMKIRKAAEEIGFFYISDHGIPKELINQAYNATKDFFKKPKYFKNKVKINSNHHGFLSIGQSKMEGANKTSKHLRRCFT